MDLPNPIIIPHKQLEDATTEDVTLCISRVQLGREELLPQGGSDPTIVSSGRQKRCSYSDSSNSNEKLKKIVRTEAPNKKVELLESTIDPLPTNSIRLSYTELERPTSCPKKKHPSSDLCGRVQRTEIAAIIAQASAVGFQMGTSNMEGGKASSLARRRRHQRRNSVIYRSHTVDDDDGGDIIISRCDNVKFSEHQA